MATMTESQVRRMAADAHKVHNWAVQNGLKKPDQIEQMAKGMAMDLQEAGIVVVDDSTKGDPQS